MSDDKKIIFSMSGLTKSYQSSNTPVLKNIYLSFFYGAKIGILGLNGSGKSTLLKIIAGVDKNYQGDVVFSQDYSVGYLEQEPKLDESKTVIEIVREGAAEIYALLDEFNKINDSFGLPEVDRGAMGGAAHMQRMFGVQKTRYLFFTGDMIGATEAARLGAIERVVPRAELPALIRGVKQLGVDHQFDVVCYGHAGDGNLHIRIHKPGVPNSFGHAGVQSILRDLFKLVYRFCFFFNDPATTEIYTY